MNKERDLLPWVLGGVSTAAVAIAVAAVTLHRPVAPATPATAPAPAPAPTAASLSGEPAQGAPDPAAAVSAAPAAAMSASPTDPAANSPQVAVAATDQAPEVQPGQIWVCTTKGVKTYSNNPCGEHSSLLEVGPVNTMSPAVAVHYANAYPAQPQYLPPYNDPRAQSYTDDDSDQDDYDSAANTYTIVQGVAVLSRRRPERHHHQHPYHHAAAPDHRPVVPDHHPTAPAPRKF